MLENLLFRVIQMLYIIDDSDGSRSVLSGRATQYKQIGGAVDLVVNRGYLVRQ
jgi:hypothetical protein